MIHVFRCADYPEEKVGAVKWSLTFPLQGEHDYLVVEMGRGGLDTVQALLAQIRADEEKDEEAQKEAVPSGRPSEAAYRAARSIAAYCSTRFPCDQGPNDLLDVPWFAEKVQAAIDAFLADNPGR